MLITQALPPRAPQLVRWLRGGPCSCDLVGQELQPLWSSRFGSQVSERRRSMARWAAKKSMNQESLGWFMGKSRGKLCFNSNHQPFNHVWERAAMISSSLQQVFKLSQANHFESRYFWFLLESTHGERDEFVACWFHRIRTTWDWWRISRGSISVDSFACCPPGYLFATPTMMGNWRPHTESGRDSDTWCHWFAIDLIDFSAVIDYQYPSITCKNTTGLNININIHQYHINIHQFLTVEGWTIGGHGGGHGAVGAQQCSRPVLPNCATGGNVRGKGFPPVLTSK